METVSNSASHGALFAVLGVAGLFGAAGVALAAVAAHRVQSPALVTAATMLMIHAVAVVAICAVAQRAPASAPWLVAAVLMLLAVALFSGDITLNALAERHLFPRAAPIGGSLLILSWLAVAGVAIMQYVRHR